MSETLRERLTGISDTWRNYDCTHLQNIWLTKGKVLASATQWGNKSFATYCKIPQIFFHLCTFGLLWSLSHCLFSKTHNSSCLAHPRPNPLSHIYSEKPNGSHGYLSLTYPLNTPWGSCDPSGGKVHTMWSKHNNGDLFHPTISQMAASQIPTPLLLFISASLPDRWNTITFPRSTYKRKKKHFAHKHSSFTLFYLQQFGQMQCLHGVDVPYRQDFLYQRLHCLEAGLQPLFTGSDLLNSIDTRTYAHTGPFSIAVSQPLHHYGLHETPRQT